MSNLAKLGRPWLDDPQRPVALRRSIIAYAVTLLLLCWGYVGLYVYRDRQVTIDRARHHLTTLATAIENHVHAMIYDGVGSAEAGAQEALARDELEDPARANAVLHRALVGGEYVREIFVATPTAYMAAARTDHLSQRPEWLDELFASGAERTNWIGPRVRGYESEHNAVFPIAKRITGRDGAPLWVGAMFGVEALDKLYERVPIAGGAVSLVSTDGAILLRAPRLQQHESVARTATVSHAFKDAAQQLLQTADGRLIFTAENPIDRQDWLIAIDRIDGYEMVAASGQSMAAVLAPWRLHIRRSLEVAGALTIIVVLLTVILILTLQGRMEALRRAREEFAHQLLATQEQERKRIANELHDSLGQNLSVIANRAQLALLESGVPTTAARHVQIIQSVASEAVAEVRTLTRNLQPLFIDQLGLTGSLRALIEQVSSSGNLEVQGRIEDIDDVFAPAAATHVYRIVQEALTNVMRHAAAKSVSIDVERDVSVVRVCAQDDGCGFDVNAKERRSGIGLASISERARLLGGELRIESTPGSGTRLLVILPIEERTEPLTPADPATLSP